MAPQYIRVIAVPPGEAPLWVREKWVGLRLPVVDTRGPRKAYVSGVLSGPRSRLVAYAWRFLGKLNKQTGYAVDVCAAVRELAKTAPDAAAWWRENASQLVAPGRKFLFRAPYCEPVEPQLGASCQSGRPIPTTNAGLPRAGATSVPKIPMHRASSRVTLHRSPFTPALILALVLFGGFWNWSHPVHPERQSQVHGNLVEWSLYQASRNGGETVHLRIAGHPEEFRIDPALFRDLMRNRLPTGFVKGAAIDITANANQLAEPLHPLLQPSVAMVWVNGLVVNGVTVFAVKDVVQHGKGEWIAWYVLVALAAAYLGYTIMSWRMQRIGA